MIQSIGVEIEGGFGELPIEFFSKNRDDHKVFRSDGSVNDIELLQCTNCHEFRINCRCDIPQFSPVNLETGEMLYVGELASPIFFKVNNLLAWVDKYYALKTNKTCGLHIHIKPKSNIEYGNLMTKKFHDHFFKSIEYWAISREINKDSELWQRLKGKNKYCKKGFSPYTENGDAERYRAINFCYGKHGTIEFRLLPCFQSKRLALDAIKFVYDFTNIWLAGNTQKKASEIIKEISLPEVSI